MNLPSIMTNHGLVVCWALFTLLLTGAQGQKSASATKGYEAFTTVRTRNVFDPERRAIRRDGAPEPASRVSTRPNFISVTGTMVSGEKKLVFFSSSQAQYSKVLSLKEKIADFTITGITAEKVELERAGKPVSVLVGQQIPLDGSMAAGASPMPAGETTAAPTPGSPASGTATPTPGAPGAIDKAEVLRRLMERRQKEL